eukprot:TRINITY_DN4184_c0_g1_i2.p1 TRINITY_DN4184_c0_g1~~TRINITY_DN4184_c0_g1_i2.p1  ORF type:complete len:294 (+),score=50.11 TRINITY_DN4184_c0_g1_i2:235-1116(+)
MYCLGRLLVIFEILSPTTFFFKEAFQERYPEGIDVVYNYVPSTLSYSKSRDEYLRKAGDDLDLTDANRFQWKGMDYTFFFLRSFYQSVNWAKRIIFIIPDGSDPPRSLNITGSHPPVFICYHSQFMPSRVLPTFNPNMVNLFLSNIPGLSENFVFINDQTTLVNQLGLEYFQINNTYIIHVLESPPNDRSTHFTSALEKTFQLFFHDHGQNSTVSPDNPILDTSGPIMLKKSIMKEISSSYLEKVNETKFRNYFFSPHDILPLEAFMLVVQNKHDQEIGMKMEEIRVGFYQII